MCGKREVDKTWTEKSEQIIVPGIFQCSRIVSRQAAGSVSINGVANTEGFSTLQKKLRSKYFASEALSLKERPSQGVDELLERIASANCVMSSSLCTMDSSVSFVEITIPNYNSSQTFHKLWFNIISSVDPAPELN